MWTSRSEGLALFLVLVLVGAGCDDDDSRPAPAHPTRAADRESGAPDFAVVADVGDQVAIVDADGTVRPVAGVRADFDVDFAVLDADRIAFVSDERVGVLNGDGTVTDQECPGCHGIAVTDAGIVTAQDNFQPGFGFDVVVLDDALHEVSRGPAERVAERPIDSTTAPDQSPVVLLGATATQAYVGYLSRTGGVRQGPWVIAAHAPRRPADGRRRRERQALRPPAVARRPLPRAVCRRQRRGMRHVQPPGGDRHADHDGPGHRPASASWPRRDHRTVK